MFFATVGCTSRPTSDPAPGSSPPETQTAAPEEIAALAAYENYRTEYYDSAVLGLTGAHAAAVQRWAASGGPGGSGGFAEVAAIALGDGSVAYTTVGFGAPVMGNGLGFEFIAFADSVNPVVSDTLLALGFSAPSDPVPIAPYDRFAFAGADGDEAPTRFFFLDGGRGPAGHPVHRVVVVPVSLSVYEQYIVGLERAPEDTPQAVRLLGLGEGRPVLRSLPAPLRAAWN